MILLTLVYEFFLTGLFSIGGGLATLPFLYSIGEKTGWFTSSDVLNMLAISESTPGPIGVNMATYVGYNTWGILGGIIATLGLIAPSIIIILIIARILGRFRQSTLVENGLYGLRPASIALVASAAWSVIIETFFDTDLYKLTGFLPDIFDIKAIILAVILFIAVRLKNLHPIVYIAAAAVIGIIFNFG